MACRNNLKPIFFEFNEGDWPLASARVIQDRVNKVMLERGKCNIMLTGGRSAASLYVAWSSLVDFQALNFKAINFYFGDERCVPADSVDSNYQMVLRTLFSCNFIRKRSLIFRIKAEADHKSNEARRYESILPEKVDIMLLGVGQEGHIASLFPGEPALEEGCMKVVHVLTSKYPFERLTITPPVFKSAESIFILAPGISKRLVLQKAMENPLDYKELPVRLVLNGVWFLSSP
jgi:6-phosphogluconolactonase